MSDTTKGFKKVVYLLLILFIITFLSGFLQGTPFEHISIFLFFLLFLGGIRLIGITHQVNGYTKILLYITGITAILFMLLIVIATIMTILTGVSLSDTIEALESIFYLVSLIFLIGTIASIICLEIKSHYK